MAITRVFRIRIETELREEFEEKFADISVREVQHAPGMVSVSILKPTKWSPDEYAMITDWIDEASLASFAGENRDYNGIDANLEHNIVTMWDYLYRYREPNINIKQYEATPCIEDARQCRTGMPQ